MSDAEGFIHRVFGDISKKSASKQIVIGAASGWATGFLTVKIGRVVAIAVGSSIILLQFANEQGYIKIDWNKISRQVDKVSDRVEESVTGEGPKWIDKAERYLDRKLDQAEDAVKKRQKRAKKWYSALIGDENGCRVNELHIFLGAFCAGIAIGVATG